MHSFEKFNKELPNSFLMGEKVVINSMIMFLKFGIDLK